jgi:MoaA/NifB/PqqE/SkfB family radical SAM enzyme
MDKSKDNGVICLAPWVHLSIGTSGVLDPCCWAKTDDKWDQEFSTTDKSEEELKFLKPTNYVIGTFPSVYEDSIKNLWNSSEFNQLRLNMLNGVKSSVCSQCYECEEKNAWSLRKNYNDTFDLQSYKVNELTNKDGSLKEFNPISFHLQLSSKCNFKCRMCNWNFSTSWAQEVKKYQNIDLSLPDINIDLILSQLDSVLENAEEINFSGGEPILCDHHYKILKKIIKNKNKKPHLIYHTNLSVIHYKKVSIFDIWKRLDNLTINVSVDGIGERGELIRSGFNWDKFISNVIELKEKVPQANIYYHATIQALNCLHIVDLHQELFNLKLIDDVNDFQILHVIEPECLSLKILPKTLKIKVSEKIKNHIKDFLIPNIENKTERSEQTLNDWISVLMYLKDENDYSKLRSEFISYTNYLDLIRNENTKETFPELCELWE